MILLSAYPQLAPDFALPVVQTVPFFIAKLHAMLPAPFRLEAPPTAVQVLLAVSIAYGALLASSVLRRWWRRHVLRKLRVRRVSDLSRYTWQAFEEMTGACLRAYGFRAKRIGGNGADGGIDLIARRRFRKFIVQCKHYPGRSVGAPVIREMFGVMHSEGASGVIVVTSGRFTSKAEEFAAGKPIILIDGNEFVRLVRGESKL